MSCCKRTVLSLNVRRQTTRLSTSFNTHHRQVSTTSGCAASFFPGRRTTTTDDVQHSKPTSSKEKKRTSSTAATSLLQRMGYGDVDLTPGQLIAIQELMAVADLSEKEYKALSSNLSSHAFSEEYVWGMSDDPTDGAGHVMPAPDTPSKWSPSADADAEKAAVSETAEQREEIARRAAGGPWTAPSNPPDANPAKTPLSKDQIDRISDFYHTIHSHPEHRSPKARHFFENNSYENAKQLYGRQVADEVNDTFEAIYDYMEENVEKFDARPMQHDGIKRYQRLWFNNVLTHIENEQNKIITGVSGMDRSVYGPAFAALPAEQLAVIVVHTVLEHLLRHQSNQVKFVQLTNALGKAVHDMIRVRGLEKKKRDLWAKQQCGLTTLKGATRQQIRTYEEIRKIIKGSGESWGSRKYVKIGAVMLEKLMQAAKVENPERRGHWEPALVHKHERPLVKDGGNFKGQKRQGQIALHKWVIDGALAIPKVAPIAHASLNPMVVPPVDWATPYNGGYLMLPTKLIRGRGTNRQSQVLGSARPEDQKSIYDGVNAIQKVAWKINTRIYDIQTEAYELGLNIGDLPCRSDVPVAPTPLVYEMPAQAPSSPEEEREVVDLLQKEPMIRAKQAHWEYNYKMEQQHNDAASQITVHHSKLEVALEYYHEQAIYFPYTLDFRGRAYPTTPVFNHLGRDHTRCLLEFAEKKPLGNKGYRWLKIHLANLMGYDKESFDARAEYIEENMSKVMDTAKDPLAGEMWWLDADDPWQALAVMLDIADIEKSGVPPEQYLSSTPVHQDGSCNGLQHYAALGRDEAGAAAVNLIATDNDKPADVYSRICAIVADKVHNDTKLTGPLWGVEELDPSPAVDSTTGVVNKKKIDKLTKDWNKEVENAKMHHELALLLDGHVDRKMVKQTVMTSVYGVTYRGARAQVENRIREKVDAGVLDGKSWGDSAFQTRFAAAGYLANLTLTSIGDLFEDAKAIMTWLADIADIVSVQEDPVQWVTPIGFPILQPYRNHTAGQIRTVMQHVVVAEVSESLPVAKQRQRTAFPPNFVHSLDATHMLMTAKECEAHGLDFAAVHDSYWTQAGSVDEMNEILRNQFVTLYTDENILEDFAMSLKILYPDVEFPEVPKGGEFNLDVVKGAKYFFA
jgi:DNA-directed RNA polymerase, mitochondrial